jgi:hypothetical protein
LPLSADSLDVDDFVVAGEADRGLWVHLIDLAVSMLFFCLSTVRCIFTRKFGSILIKFDALLFLKAKEKLLFYVQSRINKLHP